MTEIEERNKHLAFLTLIERSKRRANITMDSIPAMIYDIFRQIERLR